MEFPPPSPPPRALPAWRRPAVLFAAIALLLYGILLAQFVNACAGGSDSSGYLNHARILASGHVHIQPRLIPGLTAQSQSPFLYSPLGIKPAPDGDGLVATYPTGLPLLILAARPLGGWAHAGDVVMVLHGVAGLALTWALGALLGVPSRWRALGAALLAACPLYLDYSLQAMSDVPAMVWAAAAALAGWRARERTSWALAAGAALSIAVLVRPNNVLMAAPLCVAWWPERLAAAELRRLAGQAGLLVLGGVPGGIFFCLHGLAAYGSALTTGYGDSSTLFHSQVLGETLLHYARWLPALLSPGVCLFLLLPWSGRPARRQAAFLGAWALAYLAFYSCYQFTHETWWYLRFLLPAAPPRSDRFGRVPGPGRAPAHRGNLLGPPVQGALFGQGRGRLFPSRPMAGRACAAGRDPRHDADQRRAVLLHRLRPDPLGSDRAGRIPAALGSGRRRAPLDLCSAV